MPQTARKREYLDQTVREKPEYREVLSLFQGLFAYIDGREGETGITCPLPDRHGAERIAGGLPLIAPESLSVDRGKARAFLNGIVDVLRAANIARADSRDAVSPEYSPRIRIESGG